MKPRWYLLRTSSLPPPPHKASRPAQHPTRGAIRHVDQMQLSLPEEELRLGSRPLPEGAARPWRQMPAPGAHCSRRQETVQTRQQRRMSNLQPIRPQFTEILSRTAPRCKRRVTRHLLGGPESPCRFQVCLRRDRDMQGGQRDHGDNVFPLLLCAQDYPA